jgi:electron transfer flavoprotein-quinone oxidoreductase
MHFLPQEVIESRFNLNEHEGVVIEALGTVTGGMVGMGFIYTNKESLSVGVGCLVSDFLDGQDSPNAVLERFKSHPSIRSLLAGSETKEYSAHLIPEGGFNAIPQLFGDGWLVVGDSGHFVNNIHREGSNMAMTTGQLAAETVIELKRHGTPCTRANLAAFKRRIDASYVMKDMKKYRKMGDFMHHNRQLYSMYPKLMGEAAQAWFRVDGVDKRTKENEIFSNFRRTRSLTGLIGDAVKMARVWR